MLVVVTFFSMFMDPNAAPARTALCVTAVLTQVVLRIPIADQIPVVSYSTWIDRYVTGCLVFSMVALLEYCLVSHLIKKEDVIVDYHRRIPKWFWYENEGKTRASSVKNEPATAPEDIS